YACSDALPRRLPAAVACFGPTHRFEPDQRRRPFLVAVADVECEGHDAPAALPGDGTTQHEENVPQPARFVLVQHAGRDRDTALPHGPGEGDGVADAGLPGDDGNVDQYAVVEGVGAGVAADQVCLVEHGWFLGWVG